MTDPSNEGFPCKYAECYPQTRTIVQAPSTTTVTQHAKISSVYTQIATVTEVLLPLSLRRLSQPLTSLQAPATITDFRTQTISVPYTEVCQRSRLHRSLMC